MQWYKIVAVFRSFVVEAVCSLLFVLIGCGSTITWPREETGPNILSVSLCFGFSCTFLLNISTSFGGGFFNPALTTALAANKTLSAKRALCYIVAHLIGAIIGGGLLYVIVPYESHGQLGVVQVTPPSPLVGFGVELLMTLAVTLTVLSCTEGGQTTVDHPASIVIGLVVTACHLFAYPVTGCGINPARAFGPAVVTNRWTNHWVYWFGPIIGALLATGIHHLANTFPVTNADDLVITGQELNDRADPDKNGDTGQTTRKNNIQTQTPCELKTTV